MTLFSIIKGGLCAFIVLLFILISTIFFYPFYKIWPYRVRKILTKLVGFHSYFLNLVLGVKVDYRGLDKIPSDQNFLFVCNHMGYLDILILAPVLSLSFITSFEMRESGILGVIVEVAGCVFVERRREKRSRETRNKELEDIYKSLDKGVNIGLFPEATSTDGSGILSFKKAMYFPAYEMKKPVLVGVLNYQKINNKPVSVNNRDLLCWYGGTGFNEHIKEVLKLKSIEISLEIVELVDSQKFEKESELVNYTRDLIVENYTPIV